MHPTKLPLPPPIKSLFKMPTHRLGGIIMSVIRIGISGWTYEPWRGTFYPEGLTQKRELEYASRKVNAIEVNGTFYALQKPQSYATWYAQTPADFSFAIKGPKYITHERRLKDVATPLANFLASGIFCLKEKLGPILWQFPPSLPFLPERFEEFMAMLPHDTMHAAELSKQHSDWMKDRCLTSCEAALPMRHAIEVRHESFKDPAFIAMLRRYNIACVVGDTAGRWPYIEDVTSEFVYVRLHGDETVYPDGYTDKALNTWADRIATWSRGEQPSDAKCVSPDIPVTTPRGVFAFCDNDAKTRAPFDAMSLWAKLGGVPLEEPVVEIKKKAAKKKAAKKKTA